MTKAKLRGSHSEKEKIDYLLKGFEEKNIQKEVPEMQSPTLKIEDVQSTPNFNQDIFVPNIGYWPLENPFEYF